MDDLLKNLTASLRDEEAAMGDALKRLVLIPSGTYNKPGVDRVCRAVCELLDPLSLERRILPQENCGDMLMASTAAGDGDRRILLAGHMDTIFPEGSSFNGWRIDEERFYGPGVIDMKGGLIVGIFALKALAALGLLKDLPITWLFNSEEEIGSPVSRSLFRAEAGRAVMAFVLECGGMKVEVVNRTPFMEATDGNKALCAVIAGEAAKMGIQVEAEFRGGISDANTIAEAGTPVIDGLGPLGAHDHSDREYVIRTGDVPSPIAPPPGCRFHTRCRYTQEVCMRDEPPLREVNPNHFAACHFAEALPAANGPI